MTVRPDVPVEELLKDYEFDPDRVEIVTPRGRPTYPIAIVDYDQTWPQRYEEHRERIVSALGDQLVKIDHVGSTSVPSLPAKNIIDIDLTVRDVVDEDSYIPQLVKAGYFLRSRERHWHQHRYVISERDDFFPVQIHVWGHDQVEATRHQIMREWLKAHPDDLKLYAATKMKSAKESQEAGETLMQYNKRKEEVIKEILYRAFRSLGYM